MLNKYSLLSCLFFTVGTKTVWFFYNLRFFIEPVQELIKKGSSLISLTFRYFIRERNQFSMKFGAKIKKRHPQTLGKRCQIDFFWFALTCTIIDLTIREIVPSFRKCNHLQFLAKPQNMLWDSGLVTYCSYGKLNYKLYVNSLNRKRVGRSVPNNKTQRHWTSFKRNCIIPLKLVVVIYFSKYSYQLFYFSHKTKLKIWS